MAINKGYLTAKTDKASDEVYTPAYAVRPLIKYLRLFEKIKGHPIKIWCPFDTQSSQYVQVFREAGFEVIHSHIEEGKNFFFYEPDERYDNYYFESTFFTKGQCFETLV